MSDKFSIRPMLVEEAHLIPEYFHGLNEQQLRGMGVDPPKLPSHEDWLDILAEDFERPVEAKHFFYLLWIVNDQVAGHSNINKIQFGDHAFAHLHLWQSSDRQRGLGTKLFQLSVQEFVQRFQLKTVFCEPYAENTGPNRTLPKAGFQMLKTYETLPGWINFVQRVNRWQFEA